MSMRSDFLFQCRARLGYWYRIGGQSFEEGFDCSGFVIASMRAAGMPIMDQTALQLSATFADGEVPVAGSRAGCLYFYSSKGKKAPIDHVMVELVRWPNGHCTLAGSRGGDFSTTTIERATKLRAMVDVCDGEYWRANLVKICDPFIGEV
jgi:hypothetical protein